MVVIFAGLIRVTITKTDHISTNAHLLVVITAIFSCTIYLACSDYVNIQQV